MNQTYFKEKELENDFEELVSSFVENEIGITQHFISNSLVSGLKTNLLALYKNNLLLAGGTGNEVAIVHNASYRSDFIYWLDKTHANVFEDEFLARVEQFIQYLNMSCYAGITAYEFHYSLYEVGSFYKKHIDQFHKNGNRVYSLVSYLNADWIASDGGELKIHQASGNRNISPTNGKTVFFKSEELEHEVLLTNKQRLSVTGWLKRN